VSSVHLLLVYSSMFSEIRHTRSRSRSTTSNATG
jgi:hypothetical protein